MDQWIPPVLIFVGLVLLVRGSDRFVLAAARLARLWGMSPLLIGMLIIGMGTSTPELLVSVSAALRGDLDIAIGNPVGSNVTNVTLVLGAVALLSPIANQAKVLAREGVLTLVVTCGLTAVLWDLEFIRLEATVLVAAMVVATWILVAWARADARSADPSNVAAVGDVQSFTGDTPVSGVRELLWGAVGLAATLGGADLLVRGSVEVARSFGLSEAFIGMTLVAVGTSLPELATAIASGRRGDTDLVIGNVLGSNIFNALIVCGVPALILPGTLDPSFRLASVFMVGTTALAGVFVLTRRRLARIEGALLIAAFVAFVAVAG
jgi:cation:H+ antiporter